MTAAVSLARAKSNLAFVLLKRKKDETAGRKLLREVVTLTNGLLARTRISSLNQANAFTARALAHEHLGDLQAALADSSSAVRLAPRNPTAYENRARLLRKMGRGVEAKADRLKAQALTAAARARVKKKKASAGKSRKVAAVAP